MSILNQVSFKGKFEYPRPGRTYRKRHLRIKRTPEGWVWRSKKGRAMMKPVETRREAKRIRKERLAQIKFFKKKVKIKARLTRSRASV